ncbi:MAG: glucose 1-dehydrogenase [Thaumarchaeota archaeon]|nr:MAG: glucose 1-dehydrogenase [Nitrososphaerota archaeon]
MKGKIAVITGSSKGIGRAIAIALAKSKDYSGIVTNARYQTEAEAVSDEIRSMGCNSIAIQADVSNEKDCISLIRQSVDHFNRIDVLVNNAGIQEDIPFTETSLLEWSKVIAVDLTGPFICSREAVKQMLKQANPKGGNIINISSVHQIIPKPHYIPYATSKAGIEMMTKTMALELARNNIRANLVAPGAIQTEMNRELKENTKLMEAVIDKIPMGRVGNADEVANIVEFLASDKASYVTGTTFFVDGGMTLYPSFLLPSSHDLEKHKKKANS